MTSTVEPVLAPLIPDCHQVNSHTLHPDDQEANILNRRADCRSNVPQQPQGACPPPHSVLQEPSFIDIRIPPFWETTRDSDLTIRLISAQRMEHRAENRLIQRRLKRIMIEHELYQHMDQRTRRRLHKADISIGLSRGVSRVSGLPGKTRDDVDSDNSSVYHDSEAESFF